MRLIQFLQFVILELPKDTIRGAKCEAGRFRLAW
jgi:hypothetical protein